MSTALAFRAKSEDLARVETIVTEFIAAGGSGDSGHFARAFQMSGAIRAMHLAITDDMMKDIMHLQGTGLGFLTDKDRDGGYDAATVKTVAIEAALMGAYWVGNEFNIISGRPYLTKNFFIRKLREYPGLTDLKLYPGVPALIGEKGALVPYIATWKLNGQEMRIERLMTKIDDKQELDQRICIKVNSGMGADAILGKAERKIRAAIYARLTGSDLTDGDVDDVNGSTAKTIRGIDDLTTRLLEGKAEPKQEPAQFTLDGAQTGFNACATLTEVGKLEAECDGLAKSESDRAAIAGMADSARERIQSSRGSRSNGGKQKEMAGV